MTYKEHPRGHQIVSHKADHKKVYHLGFMSFDDRLVMARYYNEIANKSENLKKEIFDIPKPLASTDIWQYGKYVIEEKIDYIKEEVLKRVIRAIIDDYAEENGIPQSVIPYNLAETLIERFNLNEKTNLTKNDIIKIQTYLRTNYMLEPIKLPENRGEVNRILLEKILEGNTGIGYYLNKVKIRGSRVIVPQIIGHYLTTENVDYLRNLDYILNFAFAPAKITDKTHFPEYVFCLANEYRNKASFNYTPPSIGTDCHHVLKEAVLRKNGNVELVFKNKQDAQYFYDFVNTLLKNYEKEKKKEANK